MALESALNHTVNYGFLKNELIHGHFLAPCCFVARSHLVSPEGDQEAL